MKITKSALVASLLLVAPCAARRAHVYVADRREAGISSPPSLSAATARLIFAHRLGLSEFHSLPQDGLDDGLIEALNTYGGNVDSLFGSTSKYTSEALVFVEGYDLTEDIIAASQAKDNLLFSIEHAPSPQENERFLQDLRQQAGQAVEHDDEAMIATNPTSMIRGISRGHSGDNQDIKSQLANLFDGKDRAVVVVLDPVSDSSTSQEKIATWGPYRKVQKRQEDFAIGTEDGFEGLETEFIPELADSFESETTSSSWDRPSVDLTTQQDSDDDQRNTTVPRGILPQCYTSESACRRATNDCTGHGSCQSKYKYNEGRTVECFACACKSTSTGTGAKKSTTIWGGPACQKRDVSSPFFLLASITIGLLLVVTWGIGLLYSMGQEELPSVIGAGVAGPRPK